MIIGIAGKARAGKNKFAEYLQMVFNENYGKDFATYAFADELKKMSKRCFDLNYDQLWGDLKEENTLFKKKASNNSEPSDSSVEYWTPREIMQALGAFYRSIDSDFWIKRLDKKFDRDIKKSIDGGVIITDVRYVNESEYVKKYGILIKIIRDIDYKIHGMHHESEVALDDKPLEYFDLEIYNNGTLEDLYNIAEDSASFILKLFELKKYGGKYNGNKEK